MASSRDPDRGDPASSLVDALTGPVITAGIVIVALGGAVLVIAAVVSGAILPGLLGAVALAAATAVARWRRTTRRGRERD